MQVAVLGAGAIGSLIGAHLAAAGAPVTLIDRRERIRVLEASGLRVHKPDGTTLEAPDARFGDADESPQPHDVVVLALKAHQIQSALPTLARLRHADTAVVTVQNGIPWWYFQGVPGPFAARTLESVDPGGRIGAAIEPRRIVGCIAYPAAELEASGAIRHVEGDRFPLGELDGALTPRVQALSELFTRAGFKAPILEDVRAEIWLKAWGNLSFNPVSALTRATLATICQLDETRSVVTRMMLEAQQIAARLGIQFRVSLERRLEGAARVGHHKTSMLQDLEAGRPLELEALVGSVLELGRLTGVEAPTIEAVYALAKLLDRSVSRAA